jgi:hypothetical protein
MLNENIELQAKLVRRPTRRDVDLELSLVDLVHPRRQDTEAFVRDVFFKAYRARLDTFYPLLVSINYPDGKYAAVAGVRPAGAEALFSEHYLDDPVEKILNVDRQKIVEIGNLAPASAGQARWLICTLTEFLTGAGFTHVVFTAVPRLHNAFRRMGLPLTKLADARQEQLPERRAAEWGTYYESKPVVYSGDIRVGHQAFSNIGKTTPDLVELSRLAIDAGQEFAGARSATRHE